MPFLSYARHGPVLIVRFLQPPDRATDRMIDLLAQETYEHAGEPITLIGIIPNEGSVIGLAFEQRLAARNGERAPRRTSSVHFVVEGDDDLARHRRLALAGLGQMASGYRFKVHSRIERALISVAAERSLDLSPLFIEARTKGVIPRRES